METKKRGGVPLYLWMLLGFAVGMGGGLYVNIMGLEVLPWVMDIIKSVGQIFLRLLFMLVIPLLFSALVVGIAEMGEVRQLRNVGLRTTFMHNGQFNTLGQVFGFYDRAPGTQQFPDNQDPIMAQVRIPPQQGGLVADFITNGLRDARVANQTFPFDRATLFTNRPANQNTITGTAQPGSGNIAPVMIAQAPPMVGNLEFRIGLSGALGNTTARLGISSNPPVNGRITPERFLTNIVTEGTGNGNGSFTFHWPLTPFVATGGQVVYVQWFIDDASAPNGTARSAAARIPFFCGSYGCPTACPADTNQDGGVDGDDVTTFFSGWEAGESSADFNQDGGVDGADVNAFFFAWEAGC